ncbi:MAG TPA: glycerophosphodiester phosphodiesterase family protein [Chitinophagales bacterium]|nr:glycerophosphodiester phosphodiesterase family protein [Chitinophagales bacterium]
MIKRISVLLFVLAGIFVQAQNSFDIEGHRGARGLYPENTIAGFIEALKLGVNTLEMDVVISKDGQVVLSHDPTINCEICDYCGDGKEKRIYQLDYNTIKTIDCGSKGNSKFPEQKKMYAVKPLLTDVIDSVEAFIRRSNLTPVYYNIETKSTPVGDGTEHPAPDVFAKMLYDVLKQKGILNRSIVQSFDPRTLQAIHKTDATVTTALLVFNADGFTKNIKRLGFTPAIYSPNYLLVNSKLVKACHAKSIKIIPWTVNDEDKMKKMKELGVDGIISDYPDRAIKVLR